jgi:hypothetical protein
VDLARDIRSDRHPHLSEGAQIDFLGYSAGDYISLGRDTGVQVLELDLGLHENPFVDPERQSSLGRGLTEFLDEDRFGASFDPFIDAVALAFGLEKAGTGPLISPNSINAWKDSVWRVDTRASLPL